MINLENISDVFKAFNSRCCTPKCTSVLCWLLILLFFPPLLKFATHFLTFFDLLMLEMTVGCDGRTVVGRHEPAHLPPPPHHPAPRPPGPGHSALLLEVLLNKGNML